MGRETEKEKYLLRVLRKYLGPVFAKASGVYTCLASPPVHLSSIVDAFSRDLEQLSVLGIHLLKLAFGHTEEGCVETGEFHAFI